MSRIIYIDLETTGVDPNENSIVEIAAKDSESGCLHFGKATFGQVVSLGALKVNKLRFKKSIYSTDEKEMLLYFCDYLLNFNDKKPVTFLGQNVHFDFNFLKKRLEHHGITQFEALVSYKLLDLHTLSRTLIDAGAFETDRNSTAMNEVAKAIGIKVHDEKLHGAQYDMELSEKIHKKLLSMLKEIPWQS